jgi:hypothetical protein
MMVSREIDRLTPRSANCVLAHAQAATAHNRFAATLRAAFKALRERNEAFDGDAGADRARGRAGARRARAECAIHQAMIFPSVARVTRGLLALAPLAIGPRTARAQSGDTLPPETSLAAIARANAD